MARTQSSKPTTTDLLSPRKLLSGWPAAPRVKIRLARASDVDAVGEPLTLTGSPREQTMMDAIGDGAIGAALLAGLDGGIPALHHDVAGHVQDGGTLHDGYLRAALVLVAEHRDHGIVGMLLAHPPINVVARIMNATEGTLTEDQVFTLGLVGAVALTKIKAVAVAEQARGQHLGASLLKHCNQIYLHCGYKLVYGQMPVDRGLEDFYGRHGFEVLDPGEGVDLSDIFGVPRRLSSGPTQRVFTHWHLG